MDWVNRPRHTKQFFNHPVFSPLPPPPQNNSSKEIKNELVCIKRKSSLSWRIIPVAVFLITAVVAVVTSHPDTRLPVDTGHGTPQLEPQPSDTTWRVSDFTTELSQWATALALYYLKCILLHQQHKFNPSLHSNKKNLSLRGPQKTSYLLEVFVICIDIKLTMVIAVDLSTTEQWDTDRHDLVCWF